MQMKKFDRIPGMSSLVAMEFLKSWEGARAWRANQVLLVLLKTSIIVIISETMQLLDSW